MRPYLMALICLCAVMSELAAADRSNSPAWQHFKSQQEKYYDAKEDATRFANFLATKQLVERHNANPNASYRMGINHMADWTRAEYQQLNGFKLGDVESFVGDSLLSPKLAKLLEGPVPKEVDWRKVPNRVTPIKNQGRCGSCWAFSTTGLLEGQEPVRNFSKLIPLSEQELVDCSKTNLGCNGGFMQYALDDIAQVLGGIESEAGYAYEAVAGECRIDKSKFVITAKGGSLLTKGDEKALLKAVANYGPISVAIDASDNFMRYDSGVFTDSSCNPSGLNHGVLVVGYGTDASGRDYWIVKNSWSDKWGEKGYIKMKRGINLCGIAQYATLADF